MERPIIFNDAMSLAVIEGRKTVTRRPVKPQPTVTHSGHYIDAYCGQPKTEANPRGMSAVWTWWLDDGRKGADIGTCPFGVPGDKLWVRECWRPEHFDTSVEFRADGGVKWFDAMLMPSSDFASAARWSTRLKGNKWAPSIHMPRWASRTVLDVLDVRVERLQSMSEEDARAEGFESLAEFILTWESIYIATMPWASNPWVWRIEFKRAT